MRIIPIIILVLAVLGLGWILLLKAMGNFR